MILAASILLQAGLSHILQKLVIATIIWMDSSMTLIDVPLGPVTTVHLNIPSPFTTLKLWPGNSTVPPHPLLLASTAFSLALALSTEALSDKQKDTMLVCQCFSLSHSRSVRLFSIAECSRILLGFHYNRGQHCVYLFLCGWTLGLS